MIIMTINILIRDNILYHNSSADVLCAALCSERLRLLCHIQAELVYTFIFRCLRKKLILWVNFVNFILFNKKCFL